MSTVAAIVSVQRMGAALATLPFSITIIAIICLCIVDNIYGVLSRHQALTSPSYVLSPLIPQ